MNVVAIIRKIWSTLPPPSRRQAIRMSLLQGILAGIEILAVAVWYPFTLLITRPEPLTEYPWLGRTYEVLGFQSTWQFTLFTGGAVIFGFVACTVLKVVAHWQIQRFVRREHVRVSTEVLRRLASRPYVWYLSRNTSAIVSQVRFEVGHLIDSGLSRIIQIPLKLGMAVGMVGCLLAVDPIFALVGTGLLGGAYLTVSRIVRRVVEQMGDTRARQEREASRIAIEALGAAKEAKISPVPESLVHRYEHNLTEMVNTQVNRDLVRDLPAETLEIVIRCAILGWVLWLLMSGAKDALALTTVSIAGLIRVAPKFRDLYNDLVEFGYVSSFVNRIHEILMDPAYAPIPHCSEPVDLEDEIEVRNVSFRYPESTETVLEDIGFTIPRNTSLALVGETGAGKTTLAEIIGGLLEPTSGSVLVDGVELEGTRRQAWRQGLGYVPQDVYLFDETVRRNIAFGVPDEDVDELAVQRAARMARIHDFISQDLSDGYNTVLGERGVLLSGGQRQRIGIARALYRNPKILIFDEATSALDNVTEQEVLEALMHISRQVTLIIIAHRLTTVEACDQIAMVSAGRLLGIGTYPELVRDLPDFARLARIAPTRPAADAPTGPRPLPRTATT